MAERFHYDSVYETEEWMMIVPDADGMREKYFELLRKEIEKSEFPGLSLTVTDYKTGGVFLGKEVSPMLCMKPTKSQFKKFEILFRCSAFGNAVLFSRYETMSCGFFDALMLRTGADLYATVRKNCENLMQYEEFIAIDNLANLVYDAVLFQMDPRYQKNKRLLEQLTASA